MERAVLLALLCISLTRDTVVGQVITGTPNPLLPVAGACGGGEDELAFIPVASIGIVDFPNAIDQCSGEPQVVEGASTPTTTPICGPIDENAARRACWTSGTNLDDTRTYRLAECRPHITPLIIANNVVEDEGTGSGSLNNQPNYECQGDCFEVCYASVFTTAGAPLGAGDCGLAVAPADGDRAIAAVACFDRNECIEGALTNCGNEFDCSCDIVDPCVENAVCTNDPLGWTCVCDEGYVGVSIPADVADAFRGGAGCRDRDECALIPATGLPTLPVPVCPPGTECQNTLGSYVCSCNNWKLYQYGIGGDDQCSDVTCPGDMTFPNSTTTSPEPSVQSDRINVACDAGFVSSINPAENEFDLTCRDGRWCSCEIPQCLPQECGDPGSDPNAMHPPTPGVQGDVVTYTCVSPGYQATDGGSTYTRTCDSGTWTITNGPCQLVNLCLGSPCGANAGCQGGQQVPGGYVCICNAGFRQVGSNCIAIGCGLAPPIEDASASQQGTNYLDETVYECNTGYTTCYPVPEDNCDDEFILFCNGNGVWTPTSVQPLARCFPVNCGDPGVVCNSERAGSRFFYDDEVRYTCKEGYESSGGRQYFDVECRSDGTWTQLFTCDDVDECDSDPCTVTGSTYPSTGYRRNVCINSPGSYRCVCYYGYNLDVDGTSCKADIGFLGTDGYNAEPCDWYTSMSLCRYGQCRKGADGRPYCECNDGYTGTYCTNGATDSTEVIAIVGLAIAIVALLCCVCICICVCSGCNPGVQPQLPVSNGIAAQPVYGAFNPRRYFNQLGY